MATSLDSVSSAGQRTADLLSDIILYSFPRTTLVGVLATPLFFLKARHLRIAEPAIFVLRGVFASWVGTLAACTAEVTVPRLTGKFPEKMDITPLATGFFGTAIGLNAWFASAGANFKPLHIFRPCLYGGLIYFAYYWIDDFLYSKHLLKTLETAADANVPTDRVRPYLRRRYSELLEARKYKELVTPYDMWSHPDAVGDLAHRPDAFYPTPRLFFPATGGLAGAAAEKNRPRAAGPAM